nr:putative ribonuclease H-like domain-containing protein [Tanacetum cinerariifolium]
MADFHYLDDAREIWLAVKARFGGNEESKKMRKTMLKQEFLEFNMSEEEGLHKGYDRFQKILSQLNQMQAKPDNDDVNIKFLMALPPSWSQVALTLKTRGGLEYLSFDDLYNKLSIMEDVLHLFVAENKPTQQLAYKDFEQLGHFARECNVKKVDKKARYSAFKILEVKIEEPKAMESIDFMLNWNEHEAKNKTKEGEQVYGLMAGFKSDFADHVGNAAGSVYNAGAEFAMMGISPKVHPYVNKDIGIVDSGCSRSMTGNKEKLDDFVQVKGGTVTCGGGDGKITGKGTIRTSKLNFENVYYLEELQHFNLFFVSQICDKKNKVLFTNDECLVLTKEFTLPDESHVVLRILRRHDLYTFNLSDIQPEQHINFLLAKASLEESTKWHKRMAHVNFKIINKLAKNGLVEGLPLKLFTNEHNCVACNKGKQHKASYKAISAARTISEPL